MYFPILLASTHGICLQPRGHSTRATRPVSVRAPYSSLFVTLGRSTKQDYATVGPASFLSDAKFTEVGPKFRSSVCCGLWNITFDVGAPHKVHQFFFISFSGTCIALFDASSQYKHDFVLQLSHSTRAGREFYKAPGENLS